MYRQGVIDGQEAGLKIAMAVLNQALPKPIYIDATPINVEKTCKEIEHKWREAYMISPKENP
jgi:hypothetical protein